MEEKPKALIIDDQDKWLQTLEEALNSYFHVEKAKSVAVAQRIISNNGQRIMIALVDLLLEEDKTAKQSGLDAMFLLNKERIPCIAATAFDDGKMIRDAFVIGRVKDVWFKDEEFVLLREKIERVLINESEKELIKERPDIGLGADNVVTSKNELDLFLKQIKKYKNLYITTSAIITFLMIMVIFNLPEILPWWSWLINHPKRLGLQISFSLISIGVAWVLVDTDNKRKIFALGSIVIATLIAVTQII